MRRTILACLASDLSHAGSLVLAGSLAFVGSLAGSPVLAQEPLLLRIRPADAAPAEIGTGGGMPSADEVARARAAREAVWERADRRARIAIASVCTGCLPPERPARFIPLHPDEAVIREQAARPEPPAVEEPPPVGTFAQHSSSQTGTP